MSMKRYFIGVDGGGSKTLCLVASEDGTILGRGKGGPLNPVFVSREEAKFSLRQAVAQALKQAAGKDNRNTTASNRLAFAPDHQPLKVETIYIGAPAVDEQFSREALEGVCCFERLVSEGDDALNAFTGALVAPPGVVVLAGTGSFAMGIDAGGNRMVVGGWGTLLGDEGSGYEIGLNALKAVARASEGREEPTMLTQKLRQHLHFGAESELRHIVYRTGLSRHMIAELAVLVSEAASEGDAVAARIISSAGKELGLLAVAVLQRLALPSDFHPNDSCRVALTGGVRKAGRLLLDHFTATVAKAAPGCEIVEPRYEPVVGSLLLALRKAGIRPDRTILTNLDRASRLL
ncbi:MAG: N-acetylglucosamine kinase [Syntrophothermus sp.]